MHCDVSNTKSFMGLLQSGQLLLENGKCCLQDLCLVSMLKCACWWFKSGSSVSGLRAFVETLRPAAYRRINSMSMGETPWPAESGALRLLYALAHPAF